VSQKECHYCGVGKRGEDKKAQVRNEGSYGAHIDETRKRKKRLSDKKRRKLPW